MISFSNKKKSFKNGKKRGSVTIKPKRDEGSFSQSEEGNSGNSKGKSESGSTEGTSKGKTDSGSTEGTSKGKADSGSTEGISKGKIDFGNTEENSIGKTDSGSTEGISNPDSIGKTDFGSTEGISNPGSMKTDFGSPEVNLGSTENGLSNEGKI